MINRASMRSVQESKYFPMHMYIVNSVYPTKVKTVGVINPTL